MVRSEQKKEALRLCLAGQDAKFIAGTFFLSMHMVNERVRDARCN